MKPLTCQVSKSGINNSPKNGERLMYLCKSNKVGRRMAGKDLRRIRSGVTDSSVEIRSNVALNHEGEAYFGLCTVLQGKL